MTFLEVKLDRVVVVSAQLISIQMNYLDRCFRARVLMNYLDKLLLIMQEEEIEGELIRWSIFCRA